MGLVALLIVVDLLILTAWYLADPIRCSRSVAAAVKVQSSLLEVKNGLRCKNRNVSLYHSMRFLIVGDGETSFLLPISDGCMLLCIFWLVGNRHGCKEGQWCSEVQKLLWFIVSTLSMKIVCLSDNKPAMFSLYFPKAFAISRLIAHCALSRHAAGCRLIHNHILKVSFRLPVHWISIYILSLFCWEIRSDVCEFTCSRSPV